jgi:hypothetical protein
MNNTHIQGLKCYDEYITFLNQKNSQFTVPKIETEIKMDCFEEQKPPTKINPLLRPSQAYFPHEEEEAYRNYLRRNKF